jgi:tetratricopeptide (TPR) repeat protein
MRTTIIERTARRLAAALLVAALLAPAPAAAQAGGEDPVAQRYAASLDAEARGDYATALNEVLTGLRAAPSDYVLTLRAAWLYYMKSQLEDAIITYRKAAALAPKAVEPQLGLTLPLLALERWKETEETCRAALKLAPGDYTALSRLAWAQYNQARYADAAATYRQVLELYPSDVEMMLGLAWSHTKQGEKEAARALFLRVIQLRTLSVRARAGLEACCP